MGRELGLLPGDAVNMAGLAVDRHAASAIADKPAFRFLGEGGRRSTSSYRELVRLTDRFGNALKGPGIAKGNCVFFLCGRRANSTWRCSGR